MEEGGGHGFFVLVVCFLEEEGEEEDDVFFTCCFCCSFFVWLVGWLVGWLGGFSFLVSCLREVLFLYQLSPIMQNVDILFSFFFFSLSFFLVELKGWLDYASPGRAD